MPVPKLPVPLGAGLNGVGVNGVAGLGLIIVPDGFGSTWKLPPGPSGVGVEGMPGTVVGGTLVRGTKVPLPGARLGRTSAGLTMVPPAPGPNRVGGEGIVGPAGGTMIVPGVDPGAIPGWAGTVGMITPGCAG